MHRYQHVRKSAARHGIHKWIDQYTDTLDEGNEYIKKKPDRRSKERKMEGEQEEQSTGR